MLESNSVPFGRFAYQPYFHSCPVCGCPVYDIPPFNDDCKICSSWFIACLAGGAP